MAERDVPFLQGGNYTAAETRRILSALTGARDFTAIGVSTSPILSAGGGHGVVGAGDMAVTAGAGTTVVVAAGLALVRGTQQSDQGVYVTSNDANLSLTISAADATNPRKDLIVTRVRDAEYGITGNDGPLQVVTGTPAGGLTAGNATGRPTPPENSLVLAEVFVPAGAASSASYTITDLRTRSAALGGTLVCPSSAFYPSPATAGMRVYDVALAQELVHNGTAWVPVSALGAWTSFTPVWRLGPTAITLGNATNVGRLRRVGRDIEFYARLVVGGTTGFPANGTFTLDLPAPAFEGSIAVRPIGIAAGIDASPAANARAFAEIAVAADRVGFFSVAGAYFTGTSPWTWAVDDTLFVAGSYEPAS